MQSSLLLENKISLIAFGSKSKEEAPLGYFLLLLCYLPFPLTSVLFPFPLIETTLSELIPKSLVIPRDFLTFLLLSFYFLDLPEPSDFFLVFFSYFLDLLEPSDFFLVFFSYFLDLLDYLDLLEAGFLEVYF